MKSIQRILYYTHNSVGIGHVFRARAVMTGIRRWRPDLDFLVLSGTSIPHVLLREGIEVIKLPGVEKVMGRMEPADAGRQDKAGDDGLWYKPRHLQSMMLGEVMKLRRQIIRETFRSFQPDVVMVEHYVGGLLDEMVPILAKGRSCGNASGTIRVALSRGIMGRDRKIFTASGRHRAETMLPHYDLFYCFDDDAMAHRDGRPDERPAASAPGIAYVGKITDKCRAELPERDQVLKRLRLQERPVILLTLSRHGDIAGLCLRLLQSLQRIGLDKNHQVIFVIDPYLDHGVVEKIQQDPLAAQVRFLPFFYPLIDLIHIAEIVICRAGYNTINELLLTGAKALVIPEAHPSGEQEERAATIPRDNIAVLGEADVLETPPDAVIRDLVAHKASPLPFDFNKYKIGKRIITDLETCFPSRRDSF